MSDTTPRPPEAEGVPGKDEPTPVPPVTSSELSDVPAEQTLPARLPDFAQPASGPASEPQAPPVFPQPDPTAASQPPFPQPQAVDPYAERAAQNPYAQDPHASNPYARNPSAQNAHAQNSYPQNSYPQSSYPQAPHAQTPHAQTPYAGTPLQASPYGATPPPGTPFGATPWAPYGIDPRTGIPFSDKSKVTAGLLQIFLGSFGVGRFYLGDAGTAVAQILVSWLTCGVGAIWPLIDGIIMLTGDPVDSDGRPLHP